MAFWLPYFGQLVIIRNTTQSYNHFVRHYKFDKLLKQINLMFFLNHFQRGQWPP
jgi:hypothetical protein